MDNVAPQSWSMWPIALVLIFMKRDAFPAIDALSIVQTWSIMYSEATVFSRIFWFISFLRIYFLGMLVCANYLFYENLLAMMCNYWKDTLIQYGLMLVHLLGLNQLFSPDNLNFEFGLYIISNDTFWYIYRCKLTWNMYQEMFYSVKKNWGRFSGLFSVYSSVHNIYIFIYLKARAFLSFHSSSSSSAIHCMSIRQKYSIIW